MLKDLDEIVRGSGNVHVTQPSVVSITQSCETGTVYQLDEIQEISKIAHKHKMSVHMGWSAVSQMVSYLLAQARQR